MGVHLIQLSLCISHVTLFLFFSRYVSLNSEIVVSFTVGFISRGDDKSKWSGTFFGKWSTFNCCKGWYSFFRMYFRMQFCGLYCKLSRIKNWRTSRKEVHLVGKELQYWKWFEWGIWFRGRDMTESVTEYLWQTLSTLSEHCLLPGSYKALGHCFWGCGCAVGLCDSSGETWVISKYDDYCYILIAATFDVLKYSARFLFHFVGYYVQLCMV